MIQAEEQHRIADFCEKNASNNYAVGLGCIPVTIGMLFLAIAGILRFFLIFPFFDAWILAVIIIGMLITLSILDNRDQPHGSDKILAGAFFLLLIGGIYTQAIGAKPLTAEDLAVPQIPISNDNNIYMNMPEVAIHLDYDAPTEIKIFMPEIQSLDYYYSYNYANISFHPFGTIEAASKAPNWGDSLFNPTMMRFNPWFTVSLPLNETHANQFYDVTASMIVEYPIRATAGNFTESTNSSERSFRLYILKPRNLKALFLEISSGPIGIFMVVAGLLLLAWGAFEAQAHQWKGVWSPNEYREVQKGLQFFDTFDINRYLNLKLPTGAYIWINNESKLPTKQSWKPSDFTFETHDMIVKSNGEIPANGKAFGVYLKKAFLEGLELQVEVLRNGEIHEVVWIDEAQAKAIKDKRLRKSNSKGK